MLDEFLDILFPPKCPFCKTILESSHPICRDCLEELPFIDEDSQCMVCGRPIGEFSYHTCEDCRGRKKHFEHSFTPLVYKDLAKEGIIAFKTSHPYYKKAFAFLLADRILSSKHYTSFDCITYVPQNRRSLKKRGFNQSKLIAEELAKILGVPCIKTLIRTNDGEVQHTLSAEKRRENVKKCFFETDLKGDGTILLVDDIYTTGATADYCSRLLKKMGFKKIYLAIALIRDDE